MSEEARGGKRERNALSRGYLAVGLGAGASLRRAELVTWQRPDKPRNTAGLPRAPARVLPIRKLGFQCF